MKRILLIISIFSTVSAFAQGNLGGNVLDEQNKSLVAATVEAVPLEDTLNRRLVLTDKDGLFYIQQLPFGYYQLRISYADMQTLTIDSIYLREERPEFNLEDLVLKSKESANLNEVVIFAEKPLIQSKDGNITFNVAESPLSAGSTAGELLQNVPLVSKDADGNVSVRGKEPKILIDDKPVELNLQQLQDLLESLPGSSIEKIEVMTNPPPQYANEQGGVINIVTRKGRVGKSARISVSGGTRGEASTNGNFTYRKRGLALNVNAGVSYNRFNGYSYSKRNNLYKDSSNFFNTTGENNSKSLRPNLRASLNYDISKFQSLDMTLQLNGNNSGSNNFNEYTNLNRFNQIYRLSQRNIHSDRNVSNANFNLSYRLRSKKRGESFRVIASANLSGDDNDRDYYQEYFNPDHTSSGRDSTQQQITNDKSNGYTVRVSYDRRLKNDKTSLSIGSYYLRNNSDVIVDASYLQKPDNIFVTSDVLSNDFRFHQGVVNLRYSMKQVITENFSISGGISAEQTNILFELFKENRNARNDYWTWLPYANFNKSWGDKLTLSFAYRRSIRRPRITELNPTIDFSNPYSIKFGNEKLKASTADNFDLVVGTSRTVFYLNFGLGYNIVNDVFGRVKTLLPDGKTQTTWENISGRKEYEVSTWGGLTMAKKLRANISATYRYNQYSAFDKSVNRYRNGGSFTSNLNTTYTPISVWNLIGSFTFNRFANPQGFAKWNTSMNIGVQRKLLNRKLVLTLNAIDPFVNQERRTFIYAPQFNQESFSLTHTRNFRLSIAYNFNLMKKPSTKFKI